MAMHSFPSSRFAFSFLLPRLVLAALVWCHASLQLATAQQVRVGVILNMSSPIRVGIEMAVEDYYATRPGSAARVGLLFRDSGGDVLGAASAGKALLRKWQLHVFFLFEEQAMSCFE
jgi:glutamate receptor, ionotropic, plant